MGDQIMLQREDADSDSEFESDEDSKKGQNGASPSGKSKRRALAPRFVASASRDKSIMVWDLKEEECVMKLLGHENWVRSLVFHPCGRFLISSADDKSIRV